jgi:malonyl CoA-acyl carrier protein transacylase/phosphopantetheinyl transferase (holo-ACP synthase)
MKAGRPFDIAMPGGRADSADGGGPGGRSRWETEAVLLGAPDRAAWLDRARRLAGWLDRGENLGVALKDLAHTINAEHSAGPFRVGLVVETAAGLRDRLRALVERLSDPSCRSIRDARGAYFDEEPLAGAGSLAFLFPGEGSQYPGMLADLCPHFAEVRALFDTADRVAREQGHARLPTEVLFGGVSEGEASLWSMGTAINVVLSAQWALHQVLTGRLGLRPGAVAGHSSGEFLALAAAGVVRIDRRFEDRLGALGAVIERLDAEGRVPGARLVAVAADRARVEDVCREVGPDVSVAIDNCPHQVVLAGPPGAVEAVVGLLRSRGVLCEDLPFDRAYHTPAFAEALGPVRAFFDDLPFFPPAVPLYSCAVAGAVPGEVEAIRRLAVEQWARPVAFRSTVEAMYADGVRIFVEVGARGNLTGFVADTLRGRPHLAVAANLPRRSGLTQLNHLAASLYAQGVPIRPDGLTSGRSPARVDLDADRHAIRTVPTIEPLDDLAGRPSGLLPGSGGPGTLRPLVNGDVIGQGDGQGRESESTRHDRPSDVIQSISAGRESHSLPPCGGGPGWRVPAAASRCDTPHPSPPPRGGRETIVATQWERARELPPPPTRVAPRTTREEAMRLHFQTMERFLETQRQVMGAYRATVGRAGMARTAPAPEEAPPDARPAGRGTGPWVGVIEAIEPGRALVAVRSLVAEGDPVAEHHTLGGRRVSAIDPSRKGLPVVPFTVMAEMLAQAASALVPGRAVVGLRDVQAHRWIRYEAEPVALEIRARRDPEHSDEVRVAIRNRGTQSAPRPDSEGSVVEGRVILGSRATGPEAPAFELDESGVCRFTAEELYADQWLFHGPALRALARVGRSAPGGIEGTLRVLPRGALFRASEVPSLCTDPIVLDAFTHLLGCWGLDRLADGDGDVIFPLRLGALTIFGADPPEGSEVSCRIAIREVTRHRVRADADLVGPDGRVWIRIADWEDWRFYWPARYRDQFRQPDQVFVGEPLALPGASAEGSASLRAVWLEPPADMGRPVWRDVLEWVQLGPDERAACRALPGPETRATHRLWGRIAAKEAARRLWADRGGAPVYPADLAIEPDPHGRPRLRSLLEPWRDDLPAVSIAHAGGVAVALAALDPGARVGIDVEPIVPRGAGFEAIAFDDAERALLDEVGRSDRAEWVARFWCAKEAVAKASGRGMAGGPSGSAVVAADLISGVVAMEPGPELRAACPEWSGRTIRVVTARRGDYAWAWTVGDGGPP